MDLDPDKVYIFGQFAGQSNNLNAALALGDPEEPTSFCAGFDEAADPYIPMTITESRRIAYESFGSFVGVVRGIYSMVPDAIRKGSSGLWAYPSDPISNDVLSMQTLPGVLVEQMVSNPVNNEVFYKHDETSDIYSGSLNGEVYYTNPFGHELIGALGDGSLLLFDEDSGVVLLDTDLTETVLTPPIAGPFEFTNIPAKIASNGAVWVAVALRSEEDVLLRWRIDLADNNIINEGRFADFPEELTSHSKLSPLVFDGFGDIWEMAGRLGGTSTYVVKRPIASSGRAAEIVYSSDVLDFETSWASLPSPAVRAYKLVTGP